MQYRSVLGFALLGLVAATPLSAAEVAETPYGAWLVEDIGGAGVIDNAQTTLILSAEGKTGGRGGCNAYTGDHQLAGDKLSFGGIAATMMACPEAVMNQEQAFFRALGEVQSWRVDGETGKLDLLDGSGQILVVLSPME
jgi:putative lipoprotein